MTDPVSTIRNLGPASVREYSNAGIQTATQLRELGADAAYAMLIAAGTEPHFIGYYALVMGLQGRPWNDCKGAEKAALRVTFDKIRATGLAAKKKGHSDIEVALDKIGVIRR